MLRVCCGIRLLASSLEMKRILSDKGVHLRLVGTELVFSSVLLVYKLVLVVLVYVHSPEAGRHGVLRHV